MYDTFYDVLASRYDILQSDMDCARWADYLTGLIDTYCHTGPETKSIIDLGCGTGSVDVMLAAKGFDVTGIDNAGAMLETATAKKNADKVTWVLHDIIDFEMDGKADCFLSLLDTMDHIMSKAKISGIMRNVADEKIQLYRNVFYQDYEDFLLLWINHYDEKRKVNTAELTFFEDDGSGKYDRYDGELKEKFYPESFFVSEAAKAGLTHKATYGELTLDKPGTDEERIFMVFAKE